MLRCFIEGSEQRSDTLKQIPTLACQVQIARRAVELTTALLAKRLELDPLRLAHGRRSAGGR